MSNIIPPLLSSSPPPMVGVLDEEDDDEFGDFAVATNMSYGCDALSLPSSPQKSPKKNINQSSPKRSSSEISDTSISKGTEKDFQDKRKNSESIASVSESNTGEENHSDSNLNNLLYNNGKIKPKTDNKYNTFQYFPEIPPDIVPDDEDEFEDVDNGFVEEFDEFQDFESASNVNGSVSDVKNKIPEETDIPNVHTNPEPSLEVPVINDCKPCETNLELDDNSIKVERHNLEITESINGEISTVNENTESDSANTVNDDLEEPTHNESVVTALPTPNQPNITSDTPKSEINGTTISESKDIQLKESDQVNNDAFSESEDDFGDFENHSFTKLNMPDIVTEPAESIKEDQVPVDPAIQELDDNPNISDDDFGDFETSKPKLQWDSDPFTDTKTTDLDTNNFGDFDSQVFEEPVQEFGDFAEPQTSQPETSDNDDFGDFNDCSLQPEPSQSSSQGLVEDSKQFQRILSIDLESIPQRAQAIILDMFPIIEQTSEDYCEEDFTKSDVIFNGLGDVTDTCALLYQWSKSNSQNCFLRALNIDTRNILYGPRWNESMPRYAATLGYTPLEPVKSEILAPTLSEPSTAAVLTSSQTPSSDIVPPPTEIPSAQFDWVGSGLTNPLENSPASTMLLDLEQLVASLDIQFSSTLTPNTPNSPSPVNDIDDWEFWLRLTPKKVLEKREPISKELKNHEQSTLQADISRKTSQEMDPKPIDFEFSSVLQPEAASTILQKTHSDSGSVKSLQLEIQPEEIINKTENNSPEFENFTSFQSTKIEESSNFSNWSFNAIPLRETHISNLQSEPSFTKPIGTNFEEPGWLKPTILTPDLPRKINLPEQPREEEEDFAEFQTSKNAPTEVVENIEPEIKSVLPCVSESQSVPINEEDDEFTDFQSTLPNSLNNPTPATHEPLQPAILEPLKPSLLQPMTPAVINWPDPGITDDDLIGIELNYKPKLLNSDSEPSVEVKIKEKSESLPPVPQTNQETSKTVEEDDWSDFVSSQGPPAPTTSHTNQSAFKTSQFKQPNRTSTPELSLCIPQLNNIQPPKRPVPVITQQGLIQTKLPVEPPVQPSVQQSKTYPQVNQNGFQPSLISNQFAAQFGQGLGYQNIHQNRPPQIMDIPKQNKGLSNLQQDLYTSSNSSQYFLQNSKPPPPIASSKPEEFDEEWTDFVSSQPAPPQEIPNGLHGHPQPKINFDWNRPPQFTSWSANVTPNIITNPVSFDSFQSYSSPAQTDLVKNKTRKNPNVVIPPKKNTIPSISSVPDLEFIAPKSRTWKK